MRRTCFTLLTVLLIAPTWLAAQGARPAPAPTTWPTVAAQMAHDHVRPGSALEKLIRANQDFHLLRPDEAQDHLGIPLWLRVVWRKAHPGEQIFEKDPTKGYPLVLREVAEWMATHQDLTPGPGLEAGGSAAAQATSISGEQRISGAATNPRSESDIRVNYNNPQLIIAASNNIGGNGQQAQYRSGNAGATWTTSFLPLITGDAFHSDPTVDWTSDGTAWSTTIGINSSGTNLQMLSYRSTDGGATWSFDATFSGSQTSADKEMLWADHSAASPFRDNLYTIWHNGTPVFVNRRNGPAGSWGSPLRVSGSETTGTGIGADIKTNSAGDVFAAWPDTGSRGIYAVKSTNGGTSYAAPIRLATTFGSFDIGVPSFASRRLLIYVTLGAFRDATRNNVYATWADLSGQTGCTSPSNEPGTNTASSCKTRIWFARSTNGGSTWSTPIKINDQASLNDQFNQWMVVDENTGAIAIAYYDTVNDPNRKKTNVFYQISFNDGASWNAPVQVASAQTDETVAGADSGNQYGDYNSLSGIAGLYFPSWTDRRSGGREEIWTAAVSEVACTPPAAPTGLTASATVAGRIDLSWNAVAGATSYKVFRSTSSAGTYSQIGTSATTSFADTSVVGGTTYFYKVRASAACDSTDSNIASATAIGGGGTCTVQTLYSNGFETGTGLADWTSGTFVSGGSTFDWHGIQSCTAQSGSRIFRFGGSRCTSNYGSNRFTFAQPQGSTGIAVPAGATQTRLTFGHRYRFESGFDGGTLVISVNGTNYFYMPASTIISGAGFNGTLSAACPPPGAAGAAVFTGAQTSFVNTTVDLDAACNVATGGTGGCAGQSVRVAFTSITDCSVTDDGWFLDNVKVTACVP